MRPEIGGRVVDAEGAPVNGARVRACAHSHWTSAAQCALEARTTTADDGRFAFTEEKRVEWCCLGEAPLYETEITMCTDDARHASTTVSGRTEDLILTAGPPDDARCVEPPTFERPRPPDDDQGERRP